MQFGQFGRNAGWYVTGLVAVVYGVGVAFLGSVASQATVETWTLWGSAVVGVLFVVFMVVPFFLWLFGSRHPEQTKARV